MKQKKRKHKSRLAGEGRTIVPGVAPGTLKADPNAKPTVIRFFGFNNTHGTDGIEERTLQDFSELIKLKSKWQSSWIKIEGLANLEAIEEIGRIFNLHQLALEDVINVNQRPKVEEYEDCLFITTRLNTMQPTLHSEQISIFVGSDYVISFQEHSGDCFDAIVERLKKGKGRIRSGVDYLAYTLLDSVIDHNFPILEQYSERLEELEEHAIDNPEKSTLSEIYMIKRDLIKIRRTIWPQREMINTLMREETPFFSKETEIFLRDCYDHVMQVVDLSENYREITSGLIDLYLSSLSNRMNDIMKVLTLIATIFIPLSFIVGLYGMNFNNEISPWNMPELTWRFGYLFAISKMAAVVFIMLFYFWRRGWIGHNSKK